MTSFEIRPSAALRKKLDLRGAEAAKKCYQCATCSSVCELSTADVPFPRTQMLHAQWGLLDRIVKDPSIWLCHQCNDCSARCPRDAKPGDAMQVLRAQFIEHTAPIQIAARLVSAVSLTWPIVIGLPMLFWIAIVYAFNGLQVPANFDSFESYIPHWMIYAVNIPVFSLAFLLLFIGAVRAWKNWGSGVKRKGFFIFALIRAMVDIAVHRKFSMCETARPRKTGHFLVMWGFIGAFITTALVVIWIYQLDAKLPFPLMHPFKILGNLAGLFLILGCLLLVVRRIANQAETGASNAFDNFFLFILLAAALTGITTEGFRAVLQSSRLACASYLVHLGFILTLFATLPYCKFAHFVYRTLALTHERMRVK